MLTNLLLVSFLCICPKINIQLINIFLNVVLSNSADGGIDPCGKLYDIPTA